MREAHASIVDTVPLGAKPAIGSPPVRRPPGTTPIVAETPPPVMTNASSWRRAALLFALGFASLIGIYIDTVIDLWDAWGRSGTFAHGYIIFPVSGWLIWRLRARLLRCVPKVQPLALVPLVGCGLLWLVARSVGVHAPEQYAFVSMVPCLIWAIFGNDVTKRVLYPLAFLFFAVPAGDFLMPTLMDHTADFTIMALRASGVPVFREGNYFSIPSGNWSVVEACSGLRYLIASITLGFLFAYLNYRGAWRRTAFIVASLIVPIFANWFRAYLIVMIAHTSSNQLATGVDHLIYGWLFFGLVMMLLFWVGNFWRDDDVDDPSSGEAPIDAPVAGSDVRALGLMTAAVIAIVAPWPAAAHWLERVADGPRPGPIAIGAIAGWDAVDTPFTSFVPHYLNARSSGLANYASKDRKVSLFVGYYSGQLSNGPMVTYGNEVVTVSDKVWGSVSRKARTVAVAGAPLEIVESEVKRDTADGNERLLTWRWYWINGRLTTSSYLAKAYNAVDKLTGRGDDSAVVVVTTPLSGGVDADAAGVLEAFVAAAEPRIAERLTAIHDQARQ